ncbi:hypothetical protein ACH5RR_003521 [Cinchona calisaya]|uniref:Uncharacterized protein n=1 Tax=Cinchona calisaya TaxID=153742 RepID=A0ABD3AV06_9GENT
MVNDRRPPLPEKRPTKMVRRSSISGPPKIFSVKEGLNVRKESPLSNLDKSRPTKRRFRSQSRMLPMKRQSLHILTCDIPLFVILQNLMKFMGMIELQEIVLLVQSKDAINGKWREMIPVMLKMSSIMMFHLLPGPRGNTFSKQIQEKKRTRTIDIVSKEIKSIQEGLDAVAAALDRGNLCNYSEDQLYQEIEKVGGMSDIS